MTEKQRLLDALAGEIDLDSRYLGQDLRRALHKLTTTETEILLGKVETAVSAAYDRGRREVLRDCGICRAIDDACECD